MVLLRSSTLKHSARLLTQILSLSQGLWITNFFVLWGFFAFSLWTFAGQKDGFASLTPSLWSSFISPSCKPDCLSVCTENSWCKTAAQTLLGNVSQPSLYVKSQAQKELQFSLCQTTYSALVNGGIIYFVTVWWGSSDNIPLTHILPSELFWGMDLNICIF